jgi:hypothetical protein
MPLILIAGVVASSPKSDPFPAQGRPHCTVHIKTAESEGAWVVLGFDALASELEALLPGDAVAIQGNLSIEANGQAGHRTIRISVIAGQVMPLRRRSVNRLPVHQAAASAR